MNFTKLFYAFKRMAAVCMYITVLTNLTAQEYGQRAFFDRITGQRFLSEPADEEDTGEDEESDYDADASELNAGDLTRMGRNIPEEHTASDIPVASQERSVGVQDTGTSVQTADAPAFAAAQQTYFFQYTHSMYLGARFAAGVSGRGYLGYLQLESQMPIPYFELSVKNFGIGLYPLAALQAVYPNTNIPTLFLGAGNVTFGNLLKAAHFTGYSTVKASYGGLHFPRENFIDIGRAQKAVHYGVELYGGGWSGAFFASPEPKKQRMRYGLTGGWQLKRKKTGLNFDIRYLTAFIPELSGETKTPFTRVEQERQQYHKLFGLGFNFMHPIVRFETAGFCSYAVDKRVSGNAQAECDVWYRYAGVRTGASYTGAYAISWDDKLQNKRFSTFVQPYFKINIVSLHTLYGLNIEEKRIRHNGGATIQVKHRIIRWSAGWDYRKELHSVKTELSCVSAPDWFTGIQWFEKATVGTALELQSKPVNPFILKKYSVHTGARFCITEGLFCGINGTFSQSVHINENTEERLMYLQNPVYSSSLFVQFKRNGIGKVHSGKLELSVKNQKTAFDIKIGYQIQNK